MIRLLVVAVLLGLLHLLLYRRLVRATGLSRRRARTAGAALGIGWGLAVVGATIGAVIRPGWLRPLGFAGLTWMAAVFYILLGLIVIGLILLVWRIVGRIRQRPTDAGRRRFLRVASGAVVALAVGTTVYGVTEACTPNLVRRRVPLRRLPREFDGMRVAVISDLHLGPARGDGFARTVVDMVSAQRPDLIVIVGDLTDGTVRHVGDDLRPLADLAAPLGVYGVAGNHEEIVGGIGEWLDFWETLDIKTLRNSRAEIRRDGAVIDIAGVHDYRASAPYEPDLAAALRGRDEDRFVMLLAHQPNQVTEASRRGVDLQVSGHTHGGQLWPLRPIAAAASPAKVTGLDTVGGTTIYTTFGAGAWGPPVRVGAPPEIAVLELVTAR